MIYAERAAVVIAALRDERDDMLSPPLAAAAAALLRLIRVVDFDAVYTLHAAMPLPAAYEMVISHRGALRHATCHFHAFSLRATPLFAFR